MIRYLRKEYFSIKYLLLLTTLTLTLIAMVLMIGFKNNGDLISLNGSEYAHQLNLEMIKIINYLMLVSITIYFYFIENNEDISLVVSKGRSRVFLTKYIFFNIFFVLLYCFYYLIYLVLASFIFKYFDMSLDFIILYFKNYLSIFLFINLLFILIKKDNKLLSVLVLLLWVLLQHIIFDYKEYLLFYKYLIPIYETGIYSNFLGYIYYGLFNLSLFLIFFLKKSYETIDIN